MLSLGLGIQLGTVVGGGAGGGAPSTPLTILSDVTVGAWWNGGSVTESGGFAASVADLSGNGHTLAEVVGHRPLYTAVDSTLDNQPTFQTDTSYDKWLNNATLPVPAPSATPVFVWMIMKQLAWINTRRIFCSGENTKVLAYQAGITPDIAQYNGAFGAHNSGAVLNTWVRAYFLFTGSTSDLSRIAGTTATGTSAGTATAPAAGFNLFSGAGSLPSAAAAAEIVITFGASANIAALDAWGSAKYPTALF